MGGCRSCCPTFPTTRTESRHFSSTSERTRRVFASFSAEKKTAKPFVPVEEAPKCFSGMPSSSRASQRGDARHEESRAQLGRPLRRHAVCTGRLSRTPPNSAKGLQRNRSGKSRFSPRGAHPRPGIIGIRRDKATVSAGVPAIWRGKSAKTRLRRASQTQPTPQRLHNDVF